MAASFEAEVMPSRGLLDGLPYVCYFGFAWEIISVPIFILKVYFTGAGIRQAIGTTVS